MSPEEVPYEYLPVVNPHGQHPPTEAVIKWVEHHGKIVAVPACQQCHPWKWKEETPDLVRDPF